MFACLALLLAVPDMQAAINGTDKDPVTTILNNAFGPVGSRVVMGVVMISFISCVISLQAAASRLLYSYARDKMVIGSSLLKKISPTTQVPVAALFVSGVPPALIIILGFFLQDAVATIVSFAAIGIYLAFQDHRARGILCTDERLETQRQIHPRCMGLAGEYRRAGLRRRRDHQHGLATHAGCGVVHQLRHGGIYPHPLKFPQTNAHAG